MLNILLCNDDGYDALGIRVLYETLSTIANVVIVAPNTERSATGQTLTLEHPIRLEKHEDNVYSTSGFPADCALMGILEVFAEKKPDLVVSGINRGANLGQDIYYSGTVAAARQGSFHHIPSIAISTVLDHFKGEDSQIHYQTAADFIKNIIQKELYLELAPFEILNINVPNLTAGEIQGIHLCGLSRRVYSEEIEKRKDARGKEYFWIGGKLLGYEGDHNSDSYHIENNRISISLLNLLGNLSDNSNKWSELVKKLN